MTKIVKIVILSIHKKWEEKISKNHDFDDFLQLVLIVKYGHPRFFQVCWGLKEHISGHISIFQPVQAESAGYAWKVKKCQIAILAKNSIFHRVAGSVRTRDIWPEMSPWDVLEVVCTWIWYPNPFRSYSKQFWKNLFFLDFSFVGFAILGGGRIFYGSRIFDVEISTGRNTSYLFPITFVQLNSSPIVT